MLDNINKIKLRTFDSRGCSITTTSVIYSLLDKFPKAKLEVHTQFPELFQGIEKIDIRKINKKEIINFDVDLREYIKIRPHNTEPYLPIYIHMLKTAEKQLSTRLKEFIPFIPLSKEEITWAKEKIKNYDRPIIWFQSQSNSKNKCWFKDYWQILSKELKKDYEIIDLSQAQYSLRQALAITKVARAGITLDTFLVHGSVAVGAKNVLVLLGSSRKEAVTYPKQTFIYLKTECPVQPCGMHGYFVGCRKKDEKLFLGHERTGCISDDYKCMRAIKPELVLKVFNQMIKN